MLDQPAGQVSHTLSFMYCPASQAAQNVAPFKDAVPSPHGLHEVWPASAWNVFAAHSMQSNASVLPSSDENLPGGQLLQPAASATPLAEEYVPSLQFTHAAVSVSRSAATKLAFPCFPAGHSVHAVAFSFLFAYVPCGHSVHSD